MKKLYLNMVLALTLVVAGTLGVSSTVKAQTKSLEWTVQYDGGDTFETLGKDATKSTISGTMPGDTLKYVVTYSNAYDKTTDFFLNAEVLSSLEDGAKNDATTTEKAAGGAYSFSVKYTANGTTETIYDSDTVGGDSVVSQGLNQTNKDNAYVNVGRLTKGQSGVVTIEIKLDGNSQDNSYMEKLAKMNVQFAVQDSSEVDGKHTVIHKENETKRTVVYRIPGGKQVVYIDDDTLVPLDGGNPLTGDSVLPLVICGIALLIGIALILWYFRMTRDNKEVA